MNKIVHRPIKNKLLFQDFFNDVKYKMIDISSKKLTYRVAVAQGKINVGLKVIEQLKNNICFIKGDPLILAEIAGIQGAKLSHNTIPLCHPLNLEQVQVKSEIEHKTTSIIIYCMVSAFSKTGVEMEALSGVNSALLAIYDVVKNIQSRLTIFDIRLLFKEGGKTSFRVSSFGLPDNLQKIFLCSKEKTLAKNSSVVITLSERASRKEYEDISGKLLKSKMLELGSDLVDYVIIPDSEDELLSYITKIVDEKQPNIIITTGGTGLSSMDITSNAITSICDKMIPGIGELLRQDGAKYTEFSWLGASLAGVYKKTLIVCLPGNPSAVKEGFDILENIIPHALEMIKEG